MAESKERGRHESEDWRHQESRKVHEVGSWVGVRKQWEKDVGRSGRKMYYTHSRRGGRIP